MLPNYLRIIKRGRNYYFRFLPAISKALLTDLCRKNCDDYIMFVGASPVFNVEGITWFVENVAPRIKQNVYVVGSCCEPLSKKINQTDYPKCILKRFCG